MHWAAAPFSNAEESSSGLLQSSSAQLFLPIQPFLDSRAANNMKLTMNIKDGSCENQEIPIGNKEKELGFLFQ